MSGQFSERCPDEMRRASSDKGIHQSDASDLIANSRSIDNTQCQDASIEQQSDGLRSTELESSDTDTQSPSSSSASSVPPPADDWDRTLRHIGLQSFGKELQKATLSVFPKHTASRYNGVYVLLVCWETPDPKLPVACEIRRLREVFEDIYHYDVEEFQIPDDDSHADVSERINTFVKVNRNSKDDLKIVYYAGHGRLSRTKELIWSPMPEETKQKSPLVIWSGIQRSLEMAKSDVLILLDCCSAGVNQVSDGNGITELMCACAYDATANGVGQYSFTWTLMTELKLLSKKPVFTVGELYSAVYTRMQSHLVQGVDNERYPAPVHFAHAGAQSFFGSISLSVHKSNDTRSASRAFNPTKRSAVEEEEEDEEEAMVDGCGNLGKSAYQGKRRRIDQGLSVPSLGSTSNQFAEQFPEGSPLAEPERALEAPRNTLKDSLHPGDAPRALFLVRFIEDISTEDLSVELFKDWISSCPAAVAEIRIEASYKCFSTLVFITIPLAMQAYMPKDPAIMALGPVNSSIILHNTVKNTLQQAQEAKTRECNAEKFKAINYAPATSQAWTTPHWTTMDGTQNDFAQPQRFGSNPSQQWTHAPGIVQDMNTPTDDLDSWPGEASQAPTDRLDHPQDDGSSIPQRSPSWSHQTTVDDPWINVPTNVLAEADFQDGGRQNPDSSKLPATVGDSPVSTTVPTPSIEPEATFKVHNAGQSSFAEPWSSRQPHPPKLLGQVDAQETEYLPEFEWEHLTKLEPLETESRLESFPSSTNARWSLISPANWEEKLTRDVVSSTYNKSITWVSAESKEEEALLKAQRRGPFEMQKLRGETSYTRKLRACIRCRMQRIRCRINVNDPSGICQTCEAGSKQTIYKLPCVRHKLTDCVIYRTGKAPGFEFTFRWPKMKLEDITEWSSSEIRNIKVQSDVCDTPLELNVRKFVPIPQDSLCRSWMDGKKKKFKETTPYAIVNMNATVKVMEDYINKHIFECVAYWLRDKDEWVQETYRFARKYLLIAPSDEAHLLGDTFRLWFAIRRNATTEWIVGGDSLDMVPETKDRSYPLFGKIPLPPVMIQQLDMILNLRFLEPLRKKFLEDLQKITMRNNPKSWMTIYLITFIACHSFAAVTAENYKNARKHGLLRKYSMPNLMSEIHHSANVCLSHYHYCTSANNPFDVLDKWDKRETTQFAEMSTTEFHFLRKTVKMVKEREDEIKDVHTFGLYEDDLYFVSQMHEKNWTPRDTVIDYREGTVDMCH